MNTDKRLQNIIDSIAKDQDNEAVSILEKIGTNCPNDDVRRYTAKALIERNTSDSLAVVISKTGKGINDLNTSVAMSTINELLSLKNKEEALKILAETEETHEDENVKETARSVKALMNFS